MHGLKRMLLRFLYNCSPDLKDILLVMRILLLRLPIILIEEYIRSIGRLLNEYFNHMRKYNIDFFFFGLLFVLIDFSWKMCFISCAIIFFICTSYDSVAGFTFMHLIKINKTSSCYTGRLSIFFVHFVSILVCVR